MARTKGAKNKVKGPEIEKGNPSFKLQDAVPVDPSWRASDHALAPSAITEEDMALDRELERLAQEEPVAAIEPDLIRPLTKEKLSMEHLREHVGETYFAAKTLNQLEQQVTLAKRLGCDSIDAEPEVIRYYCGPEYQESMGSFMFKDVRVCFPKSFELVKAKSKMTVEQKLFGVSKA